MDDFRVSHCQDLPDHVRNVFRYVFTDRLPIANHLLAKNGNHDNHLCNDTDSINTTTISKKNDAGSFNINKDISSKDSICDHQLLVSSNGSDYDDCSNIYQDSELVDDTKPIIKKRKSKASSCSQKNQHHQQQHQNQSKYPKYPKIIGDNMKIVNGRVENTNQRVEMFVNSSSKLGKILLFFL